MASSQPSSESSRLTRENFLEKKIQILDKRLTLVEKFIDLRFRGKEQDINWDADENDENFERSKLKKLSGPKMKVSSKPSRDTSDYSDEDSYLPSSRKRLKVDDSDAKSKRQKPGPACMKRQIASKQDTDLKRNVSLKECSVRVTRTPAEFSEPVNTSTPLKSSSGRARRTPKRFEEENFDGHKARGSKRKDVDDDTSSVVKLEQPETPPHFIYEGNEEDDPDDDYLDVGPASPVEYVNENQDEDEYFTFPNLQNTQREKLGKQQEHSRKDKESHSFDDGCDDAEWNVQNDDSSESEDDSKIEKATPSRRGRKPGSKNKVPRQGNKRGKYKSRRDTSKRSNRRSHNLDLTELPTDAISHSDPSLKHCLLCNRHFKEEVYENHLESHARERHLKCPECGKSYYNQFILKKHMRIHQPEKYAKKCRQCGKAFVHSDKLLAHERWCVKKALEKNEDVDPAIIEDLKKRSKTDSSWIEEAIETGSRLAVAQQGDPDEKKLCPHCNKNFKIVNYERHLQTHIREKTWSCNMCDKAYHYKHDLVRHVALEHVISPVCEYCQKTFDDRDEYRGHLTACRRKHRKEEKENSVKIRKVTSLKTESKKELESQDKEDECSEEDEKMSESIESEAAQEVQEVVVFDIDHETESVTNHSHEEVMTVTLDQLTETQREIALEPNEAHTEEMDA